MEYLGSRGVRRTYEIAIDEAGRCCRMLWRDHAGFDQRM